jgi:UDP-N-acetylmuramyl pentapeptide phosphotransferase/UDP-N-acetylglucosamine-1-phosphate transferase
MSIAAIGFIVIASALVSASLILVLLPTLRRYALAHPNARSSHLVPTPQGGGAAVTVATIGVSLVAIPALQWTVSDLQPLGLVLFAAALIAAVGAVDDHRTVNVAPRMAFQALAAMLMIAALPVDLRVVPAVPWWIERAFLLLATVWLINLTNFMDGIDWITVAEVLPVSVAIGVLGLLGALPGHATIVAFALAGAMLGFAPFNRPVAKLFLGDVGSLPVGLLLGWLLILLAGRGHLAAAVLLPLYYTADATVTLARRIANRERFWEAHRSHFYQHATRRGFTVGDVVSRVFAVNVVLIVLAFATVRWPSASANIVALMAGAAVVGWLLRSFARGKS